MRGHIVKGYVLLLVFFLTNSYAEDAVKLTHKHKCIGLLA